MYNHLKRPCDLEEGVADYQLFREGIKPTWEVSDVVLHPDGAPVHPPLADTCCSSCSYPGPEQREGWEVDLQDALTTNKCILGRVGESAISNQNDRGSIGRSLGDILASGSHRSSLCPDGLPCCCCRC